MSSFSISFNLHYEMISETTGLFAVVLLVLMVVLLMVRARSYQRCFRSQGVGNCTKPVPEENGEKGCNQVRTVRSRWKRFHHVLDCTFRCHIIV